MSIIHCHCCDKQVDSDFIFVEETIKGSICENCIVMMPHEDYIELFDDDGLPREAIEK
jgi:hypothetical protein